MKAISDIAQLDAAAHLKALGSRIFLRIPIGVPDWQQLQLKFIFFYLLRGKTAFSANRDARDLEAMIRRIVNVKYCIATGSGREAIKLALLSMDVHPGDRVILPSFCCLSVLQPVLELGLMPVLADVGDDLQIDPASVKRIIRPGDRAIIVPHLFGGLANISELTSIAREHGTLVIDDAAQAIGLQNSKGWAGTGGDAGIYSFGLFKPLNAMGGGAFITDNEDLFSKAQDTMRRANLQYHSRSEILKTFAKVYWRKATYRIFLYNRLRQQRGNIPSAASQVAENKEVSLIAPLSAKLAASQIEFFFSLRQGIKEKIRPLSDRLLQVPGIMVPNNGQMVGFPRFVIRIDEKNNSSFYGKLFEGLLKKGIEVQPTYRPLHRFLQEAGYKTEGEFQNSQILPEKLFCLSFPNEKELPITLEALRTISGSR